MCIRDRYRAKTDPHENSIHLQLAAVTDGWELSFLVPAGRAGVVQYRDAIGSGEWIADTATSWFDQPTAGVLTVGVARSPAGARYYRVTLW